jgi:hypothetical protein
MLIPQEKSNKVFLALVTSTAVVLTIAVPGVGITAIALLVALLYVTLPLKYTYLVLAAGALFPLGLYRSYYSADLSLLSIALPLIAINMFLHKRILVHRIESKVQKATYNGVTFLLVALFFSYVRNPVGTMTLMGGVGAAYGLRTYYDAVVCVVLFFMTQSVVLYRLYEENKLLSIIASIALTIGILRLIAYFTPLDMPFFLGNLRYMSYTGNIASIASLSIRIGGMDEISGFLIAPSFVLLDSKRYRTFARVGLVIGGIFLILGGGRSAFIGATIMVLVGSIRKGMKHIIRLIVPIAIVYYAMSSLDFGSERSLAQSQFERILRLQSPIEEQTHRVEGYKQLYEAFIVNPIIGKGITPYQADVAHGIIVSGGHGAYMSILGIFGFTGVLYFMLFAIIPLTMGLGFTLSINRLHGYVPKSMMLLIRYSTLAMMYILVLFGASGNGYTTPYFFLVAGLLSGSLALAYRCVRKQINEEMNEGK